MFTIPFKLTEQRCLSGRYIRFSFSGFVFFPAVFVLVVVCLVVSTTAIVIDPERLFSQMTRCLLQGMLNAAPLLNYLWLFVNCILCA